MSTALRRTIHSTAALLAGLAMVACTTPGDSGGHPAHHPGRAAQAAAQDGSAGTGGQAGAATMAGAPPGPMKPGQMEMDAMCAMHRNMQKMPPEQRQGMMDEKMKGMTPGMRQHHIDMMQRECR
jgi:hypothetical protein